MEWVGKFDKRKGTPTGTRVGRATVYWMDVEDVLFTYSEEVNIGSGAEAAAFKLRAETARDVELTRLAENETQSSQLTTYMNN